MNEKKTTARFFQNRCAHRSWFCIFGKMDASVSDARSRNRWTRRGDRFVAARTVCNKIQREEIILFFFFFLPSRIKSTYISKNEITKTNGALSLNLARDPVHRNSRPIFSPIILVDLSHRPIRPPWFTLILYIFSRTATLVNSPSFN